MAGLSTGQDQGLRAARNQHRGAVGSEPLASLLEALKRLMGNETVLPDVKTQSFTAQTSTASTVVGSACRLYGVRVDSGNALTSTLDVIVQLLDGSVVVASTKCTTEQASEAYFFGGTFGVGIPISSSGLTVKAVAAADGSSNPAAGDRPLVTVFYGVE